MEYEMELEDRGILVQKSVSKLQHLGKGTYIFTMSANLIAANVLVAYESLPDYLLPFRRLQLVLSLSFLPNSDILPTRLIPRSVAITFSRFNALINFLEAFPLMKITNLRYKKWPSHLSKIRRPKLFPTGGLFSFEVGSYSCL